MENVSSVLLGEPDTIDLSQEGCWFWLHCWASHLLSWWLERRPHTSSFWSSCIGTACLLFLLEQTWPRKYGEPWSSFYFYLRVFSLAGRESSLEVGRGQSYRNWWSFVSRGSFVSVLPLSFSCVILLRAPGTRPTAAPCPPLRIFLTRMISARNLAQHLQLLETPYPGICLNMSGPKGRFMGARCWTRLRGLCFG